VAVLNADARFTNDPYRMPKPSWLTTLVRGALTDYVAFNAATCAHLADPNVRSTPGIVAPDSTVICGDCLGAVLTGGGFPHAGHACVGCGRPAELTTLTHEYAPDITPAVVLMVVSFVCWSCSPRGSEVQPW
jgi:hypothetical protein